ncbi:hypothetical protein DVH24_024617 [Malus domestica]|uniref:Uncharacterized protein n=1 Tax=Malus domestica TaxID=3750 RepID=A0A498JM88_MALDO|nr:hypothetical protein DVH24_024617 [Malus domestica]
MGVSNKESRLLNEDLMEEDDFEDVGSGSESEAESEEEGDVKLEDPSKKAIYNRDGIMDKLGDISWPENAGWVHKLSVDIDQEQKVDVNDDLTRELAFYTQALEGTRKAFEKLQSMGLPFLRPEDYYAEMVKSDSHMERVKSRLLVEKKKIEEADERRKARESKKLSKEIQAQKLKERAKQKKEDIESVKKWRKQRQQSGFAGGDKGSELDLAFEDAKPFERSNKKRPFVAPGDRSGGKARQGGKPTGKKPKKREIKDSKFGYGGRKGSKKQNMAETTNDLRGFNKDSLTSGNKKRKSQIQTCRSGDSCSLVPSVIFSSHVKNGGNLDIILGALGFVAAGSYPVQSNPTRCLTMLDSTLDLLTQAASNSLYVFCFCNLIIVMILVGSKPCSYVDQESVSTVTSSYKTRISNDHKQVEDDKCEQEGTMFKSPIVFGQVANPEKKLATAGEDNGSGDHHNESKECDNEDELRRRVEEFIEKVNRGWKAELLISSHLNLI